MNKAELAEERKTRHGAALAVVERRMRECSQQSNVCKYSGDEVRMYQLNVAWHWLDAVHRDLLADRDR